MHAYDRRELQRLFGLSGATIRLLEQNGYIDQKSRGQYQFGDLLVLRTVGALHAAKLPTRAINRALRQLSARLPGSALRGQVSLRARHNRIQAQEGRSLWEPGTGQFALPLDSDLNDSRILAMKRATTSRKRSLSAHEHYLRGAELERDDRLAAKAAYQQCLNGDCTHLQARINLGRLLHLEGKHREAERTYRRASEPDAILLFNLGVLLEDLDRQQEARAAYQQAIVHDPAMADAHFNLALLHERAGERQAAFRHLLSYRRLLQFTKTLS
jgi:tetratricopeptide (TPR) repeat protein